MYRFYVSCRPAKAARGAKAPRQQPTTAKNGTQRLILTFWLNLTSQFIFTYSKRRTIEPIEYYAETTKSASPMQYSFVIS